MKHLSKPLALIMVLSLAVATTPVMAMPVHESAAVEAPVLEVLTDTEMEAVEGAGCISCRIFCGVTAAGAGALSGGNVGVGLFVGLVCMDILSPEELQAT